VYETQNTVAEQPKFQELLTQLSTNETLRKQFKDYPDEVCKAFGLSDEETTQFQQLQKSAFTKFAVSLVHNRLKNTKHYIPGVCALLGEDLIDKFTMYCQRFPAKSAYEAPIEALQFLQFLTYYSDYPIPGYPYSNEVIDYEQTRLELLLEKPMNENAVKAIEVRQQLLKSNWKTFKPQILQQLMIKEYNYPIDEIIDCLLRGKNVSPTPDTHWILFVRRQTRSEVIVRRIKKSTKLLITKCDGKTKIADIIVDVRTELKLKLHEHAQFEKECRHFLKRIAKEGFLELIEDEEAPSFTA